jgi:hypothetical protein
VTKDIAAWWPDPTSAGGAIGCLLRHGIEHDGDLVHFGSEVPDVWYNNGGFAVRADVHERLVQRGWDAAQWQPRTVRWLIHVPWREWDFHLPGRSFEDWQRDRGPAPVWPPGSNAMWYLRSRDRWGASEVQLPCFVLRPHHEAGVWIHTDPETPKSETVRSLPRPLPGIGAALASPTYGPSRTQSDAWHTPPLVVSVEGRAALEACSSAGTDLRWTPVTVDPRA